MSCSTPAPDFVKSDRATPAEHGALRSPKSFDYEPVAAFRCDDARADCPGQVPCGCVSGTLGPRMRALVVEDDDVLGRAIIRTLEEWGNDVVWCTSLADALKAAETVPELVILDVGLPDGNGVMLARALSRLRPAPLVIAMSGRASASEAFQLGALGVRGYLAKPLSFTELVATIESVLDGAPDLSPLLVASVGRRRFQDVQEQVRRTMTEQALALARGNRTEAAKLLGVTRQAVQQLIRNLEIPETPRRS